MTRDYELTRPVTQPPPGLCRVSGPVPLSLSLSLSLNSRHLAPGPNYTECHLANLAGPDPGTNNLHAWARNASETSLGPDPWQLRTFG